MQEELASVWSICESCEPSYFLQVMCFLVFDNIVDTKLTPTLRIGKSAFNLSFIYE